MSSILLPSPHLGLQRVRAQARRFNWLAAGRRWRKTTGFGMCPAIEGALLGMKVVWGAPTYDQVRVGWDEVRRAAATVAVFNTGRMTVDFPTGGRITFRSLDDPDNARGHTADRVILDEAAYIKARALYEVIRPMLIDTGGDLYGMSSPNGVNWFSREHAAAAEGQRTDSMSWQAPTLGAKIVDGDNGPELVRVPHPLENPEIPWHEIESLFETMDRRTFEQEILALFVDAGDAVFAAADLDMMTVGWSGFLDVRPGRKYVTAWDIGRRRDATWGITLDVTDDPYQIVASTRREGLSYPGIIDLINVSRKRYPGELYVEANGVGDPVIEGLDFVPSPHMTSARVKEDALVATAMLLELGALRGDIPLLTRELRDYRRLDKGLSTDGVMALTIACYHAPRVGRREAKEMHRLTDDNRSILGDMTGVIF